MTKCKVYANGIFWGVWEADSAEDAIQAAANEHGTIDVGQTQASVDGMTAEAIDDETRIAVLDDCTRTAHVFGYASTEDEAAEVFMAYMKDRMDEDDFASLQRPTFAYRSETSVASPAFEPVF